MTRSILITGCSSGIGLAAAEGLRGRGWRVIAACRRPEDVAARRAEGFDSVRIDHGDAECVDAGWAEAMEITGGRLDALFNNGGHGMSGAAEDVPREAMELVFHSNVFGVHQLTRRAIPVMLAQGSGRIVMHSSVVGYTTLKWRSAYVASKHAIEGLANTMRVELRGTGLHVSILNTGPVASGFRENSARLFERWIDADASRHAEFYRGKFMARRTSPRPDPFEGTAADVVARLVHAVEARRPRTRYYITAPAYAAAFLTRVLPDRAQDWLVAKV
ncbi:SDR family NAD(P)-dependent oxidoreductase [Roseibacterium sp. SDUM158017]|uniref:SDR family NAD(P)-dependent oxidoreductase n=1 Tax=Roseicyclus salinarum TaxID=3036773 RepID=UPI0024154D7B|nr:SDR family NAD(P)-dependent oxidoreductase [Roseibacterium sp. SDUM158017]MDG4649065.1 SDR family NAD(P)-dependent oxidoreductase [Roseibacterium sp. SDUM158017]